MPTKTTETSTSNTANASSSASKGVGHFSSSSTTSSTTASPASTSKDEEGDDDDDARTRAADAEFDRKQLKQSIWAWDQIGQLASEVATSVLTKQVHAIFEHIGDSNNVLLSADLTGRLQRIERMSKLMMEMEMHHKLLQNEMESALNE